MSELISMTDLEHELEEFGLKRNRITIWRWRKKGLIPTVRIAGHSYITKDNLAKFFERARAGELA